MKINSFYFISLSLYLISAILSEETNKSVEEIHIEEVNNTSQSVIAQPEEEKNVNKEVEPQNTNNKENTSDKTTEIPSSINKLSANIKLPEMLLVQPVRRIGSSEATINKFPCGGIKKSDANTLTNIGTKLNAIWEVRTPVANGNCTVSLSPALEENFIKLRPIIKGNSADNNNLAVSEGSDYSFSCGRQLGFEFMEFELPLDYACDHCTLQVEWKTSLGDIYSCSDLMILGNKSKLIILYLNINYYLIS